jgi:DsbC/DsbD-like thiol-disulfide interchange protein
MRWLCVSLLCLALLAAAPNLQAADGPIVALQAKPQTVSAAPGGSLQLDLVLTIAPKFHINGPSAGDAGLIPTKIALTAPEGLSFAAPVYPKAKEVRVQFADKPVEMYGGQVVVRLSGQVAKGMKPGVYPVKARVSYQACDDMVCHMPSAAELSFQVKVATKP